MKITGTFNHDGSIKREIDFQGAELPDGRSIEGILNENEILKKKIDCLQKKMREESSILTKLIPNRLLRVVVELILIIGTIWGIIILFM